MSQQEHLGEDDLILHHYGEPGSPAGAARHLEGCETCRASYDSLRALLEAVEDLPLPERGADYGAQVWRRLRPGLTPGGSSASRRWGWRRTIGSRVTAPQRWAVAAALLITLGAGYFAGRYWQRHEQPETPAGIIPAPVRERILLVAVGDHLERSQMMLVELVNSGREDEPGLDITGRQRRAEELVSANRIYRQTAAGAGDAALAAVLEELERILLDIARGPSQLSAQELEQIRKRIQEKGLLFKVRVIGSQVREREKAPAAAKPIEGRT